MLITNFVMWIPFHFIRVSYLRLLLDRLGSNTELCRNIDIRSPQKIKIGYLLLTFPSIVHFEKRINHKIPIEKNSQKISDF